MEQRKLIQHGLSSLTLALPMKWLKERGLKKGDALSIEHEGSKLIISTDEALKLDKISIDISKLDRTSILLYIQSLYRFGFSEIEIHFDKPTVYHHRTKKHVSISTLVHYVISRCIGFEVIEQNDKRILIKYLTREEKEDFKIVLRRIFLLLKETTATLLDGIKKDDADIIKTIEEQHDNITKFTSYALRLLNKYGYPDVKKTSFYYHIIASLDKITDVMKYDARDLLENRKPMSKAAISIVENVSRSINRYYDFFYNFDLSLAEKLEQNRDETKHLLKASLRKLSQEEVMLVTRMTQIQEILLDLTDFRMGLEH